MKSSYKELRQELNKQLPSNICGNSKVPCGQRHKDKSCRCTGCGYNIDTQNILDLQEKSVLLSYVKGGR